MWATLQAHFSLGIAKFDTLPTHYKLLIIVNMYSQVVLKTSTLNQNQ